MNELQSEELDRELALNPGNGFMKAVKVRIGKKHLVFARDDLKMHPDWHGEKPEIHFEKRANCLLITCSWNEIKYERCSLGHSHQSSKKERNFQFHGLNWEYVEQFIEWLQLGSWTEVRGKESPWNILATELIEFLKVVEEKDKILKPASQALRRKIEKAQQ